MAPNENTPLKGAIEFAVDPREGFDPDGSMTSFNERMNEETTRRHNEEGHGDSTMMPVSARDLTNRTASSSRRVSRYAELAYIKEANVRIFSPPRQRQKWGSDYSLPHVDWGNLFYDLFYVAGFYNLGLVLKNDTSPVGILYFAGCFFPLLFLWKDKLFYDCWFVYGDDVFHKVFEMAVLVVLATVVGHIGSVGRMANPSKYIDTFGFALGLWLAHILTCIRYIECYFYGRGQRSNVKSVSKRQIMFQILPLVSSAAAAYIAGSAYFGGSGDRRRLAVADDPTAWCEEPATTHLPIVLLLLGWLLTELCWLTDVIFLFPTNGDHMKTTIPLNIEFASHRHGEWTMLMLGESVLSLLITDGVGGDYLGTFYAGIVSIGLLHLLHFRSQPHDPNANAMRRSKNAGVIFGFVFQLYSAVLVALGVSYKLLLYGLKAMYNDDQKYRTLFDTEQPLQHRWLAPAQHEVYDDCHPNKDEKAQMVAHIFSSSMALIFFFLDLMLVLHMGLKNQGRKISRVSFHDKKTGLTRERHGTNTKGILFVVLPRLVITLFIGTLSQWVTHPRHLVEFGCGAVVIQLATRLLGDVYFKSLRHGYHHHRSHEGVEDEDSEYDFEDSDYQSVDSEEYEDLE